jgi:predicted alpha/beta-hydrolase family hydrolase
VPRLCASGLDVVRFDFPYREKGSRRPDPMPVLQTAFREAVGQAKAKHGEGRRLILGGRSMGGRVATMLAADGFACDALLLLAYPLHPAGEPAKLRAAHLPRIPVPALCINGTADRLCGREPMEQVVQTVSRSWRMHWLEGADHSFHVPKSSGRSDADVLDEVMQAIKGWLITVWC